MVLYGYEMFALDLSVDVEKDPASIIQKVACKIGPDLTKFKSKKKWDLATPLVGYAEKLLGINSGSIKFNFGYESHTKKHIQKGKGIRKILFDVIKDPTGIDYPPFNDPKSVVIFVNMEHFMDHYSQWMRGKPKKVISIQGKETCIAYVLILLALMVVLGQRMFIGIVSSPTDATINELEVYDTIIKQVTRLKINLSGITNGLLDGLINAGVLDVTQDFIEATDTLIKNHPDLSIKDVNALIKGINRIAKTMKLKL